MDNPISTNHPPLILLVEDTPYLSKMYSDKFIHEGFRVIVADTVDKALVAIRNAKLDIALVDVVLPGGKSGIDLLKTIHHEKHSLPVIILTNVTSVKEKENAMKFGASDYLVKAMQTPEQVVEKIKMYVGI